MATEVVGWAFDIESDGLYLQSTKIWYIRLYSLDKSRTLKLYPYRISKQEFYDAFMEWVYSFPDGALVTAHNGLGYDAWALWKLQDIKPRVGKNGKDWIEDKHVQFVDTYVLSMYLSPDAPKHSLEYLASGSEDEKMNFRAKLIEAGALAKDAPKGSEFAQYHPIMDEYCDDDTLALLGVFKRLWAKAVEAYGEDNWIHPSFRQMQKDYWLYSAQAYTGVRFHKERAEALVKHIDEQMAALKAEVDPELPPRPLKTAEQAFYKVPAKPYRKSGEFSTIMEKWLEKHSAKVVDGMLHAYDFVVPLKAGDILPVKMPMEIEDSVELKDYFLQNGWKPHDDFWNFKKDPETGKPVRDDKGKFIRTTPKIQHQGNICPNLLKIEGEIPKKVVKFLSYRNRKGVVEGWLNNWRIAFDGRLSAEISGYAPSSRVKHRVVCNVPKADIKVLLGAEMRDLFVVEQGYWYGGIDAAALENRTLSHHTYKYDDGKFARMQTEGDPHSFNAFAFFPEITGRFDLSDPELKENPQFKPYRNKAKTGAYLLAFGGGAPKLASSLGLSPKAGQEAYDNYWEMNEGLGKLKTAVEAYFNGPGKKKRIPAIDGRWVSVRGKNVLLSCLGQGTGAIAMSYAACFMDAWLGELHIDELGRPYYEFRGKKVRRISMVHDEYSWEIEDGVQEDVVKLAERAIEQAGKALKLALPLAAEGKLSYEGSWKDVH
jgi:hypothetical protein